VKRSGQSILFICVTAILSAFTYYGLYDHSAVSRQGTYTSDTFVRGQQPSETSLDLPSGPTFLTVSHRHSSLPFRYYKRYMEVGHFVPALPAPFLISTPSVDLVIDRPFHTLDQDLHHGVVTHCATRGPPALG
jgi:hypothetical protein